MNGLPYYKAYPRDFIEGTIGMDFETKAAYRLVLDLIYMQGGALVDDARYISGLLGCSVKKWNSLRDRLISAGKIDVRNGYLGNYRADKELETLGKFQDKQRENRSRPNKNKDLASPAFDHTEPDTDTDKAATQLSAKQPENSGGGLLTSDQLLDALLRAVGLTSGRIPTYWMPPASTAHVERWRSELGLSSDEILSVARENRKRHDSAPNGPKALDGAMKRLADAKRAPIEIGGVARHQQASSDDAFFDGIIKKYGRTA